MSRAQRKHPNSKPAFAEYTNIWSDPGIELETSSVAVAYATTRHRGS